eukprot:595571-Amphidinium_carterae.1
MCIRDSLRGGVRLRGLHFRLQLGRGKGVSCKNERWSRVLHALHAVARIRDQQVLAILGRVCGGISKATLETRLGGHW